MFYTLVIQMTEHTIPVTETENIGMSFSAEYLPQPPLTMSSRNDKRERKHTAQSLPPGITHNMMKKYVVYYREFVNLKNGKRVPREYFKVESHPKLARSWVTTKSSKVPLLEKLKDANEYVAKLDTVSDNVNTDEIPTAMTENENEQSDRLRAILPKYTMLRVIRDTPIETIYSVVYDHKDTLNGFRWTCSHAFSFQKQSDSDASDVICSALQELNTKLREKYGIE